MQKECYLRALRALLREIVRYLRYDINLHSFCLHLMQLSVSFLMFFLFLFKGLQISKKNVMPKVLPKTNKRICFSILKSSCILSKTCTAERSSNINLSKHKTYLVYTIVQDNAVCLYFGRSYTSYIFCFIFRNLLTFSGLF